jgi:3-hydroxybutyryl-CoA dehydrogenase
MHEITVIGAGTMGHGIAQVCATSGFAVTLVDANPAQLDSALRAVQANLDKAIEKGKLTAEARSAALGRLATGPLSAAVAKADLVIEAVPERMELKRALWAEVEQHAPPTAILATNTSSLSVGRMGESLADPGRLIGTHFFNPVHLMELLEIVVAERTRPEVVQAVQQLGTAIGKQTIVVRDVPGFATSRLGVALGMEAIRMVEEGVASAEDIDKAMVLGYRHPVGPLRLTDMVGLDVRLNIGEYLARELHNASFEPPALLRTMVAEGRLGKKTGRGFYEW